MEDQKAAKWIKEHSQHLEKLNDWLHTEVQIVDKDTNEPYTGNIFELIDWTTRQMSLWICRFIEKMQRGQTIGNLVAFIRETVLPYDKVYVIAPGGRNVGTRVDTYKLGKDLDMYVHTLTAYENDSYSYYENLKTLCENIMKLNEGQLTALHDILCLNNDRSQSLFDRTAWGMLIKENRAKKGHVLFYTRPDRKPEDSVGGPWVKMTSSGGKRTKRHKRSNKKRSGKRSGHKRSGHKRSGHKSRRH